MQKFKSKQKNNMLTVNVIAVIFMFALAFARFMSPGIDAVIGPILTVLMLFLAFSGYAEMVIALIIVANDALGTMLFGSLSFPYLLILIVLLKLLMRRSLTVDSFVVISLILIVDAFVAGDVDTRHVLYSVLFILALSIIDEKRNGIKLFYRGVAISVFIIALHACLTGGVEFVDVEKMEYARKGILGVGIGDPNYSAYLLIVGMVCTWFDSSFNRIVKIIFSAVMVYALTVTASISGIIALCITVVGSLYVNNKNKFKFLIVTTIVIAVVALAFFVYIDLPQEQHNKLLDTYVERITEKIAVFESGDLNKATTGRVNHLSFYLDYIINNQSISAFLFGGNSMFVSGRVAHNTFIGIVLQIGFVGFLAFILVILIRLFESLRTIKYSINAKRASVLVLLSIIMSFSLSFYQGGLWALYMYFLLHKEKFVLEKSSLA